MRVSSDDSQHTSDDDESRQNGRAEPAATPEQQLRLSQLKQLSLRQLKQLGVEKGIPSSKLGALVRAGGRGGATDRVARVLLPRVSEKDIAKAQARTTSTDSESSEISASPTSSTDTAAVACADDTAASMTSGDLDVAYMNLVQSTFDELSQLSPTAEDSETDEDKSPTALKQSAVGVGIEGSTPREVREISSRPAGGVNRVPMVARVPMHDSNGRGGSTRYQVLWQGSDGDLETVPSATYACSVLSRNISHSEASVCSNTA